MGSCLDVFLIDVWWTLTLSLFDWSLYDWDCLSLTTSQCMLLHSKLGKKFKKFPSYKVYSWQISAMVLYSMTGGRDHNDNIVRRERMCSMEPVNLWPSCFTVHSTLLWSRIRAPGGRPSQGLCSPQSNELSGRNWWFNTGNFSIHSSM